MTRNRNLIILSIILLALSAGVAGKCSWDPLTWGECLLGIIIKILLNINPVNAFIGMLKTLILWKPDLSTINPLLQGYINLLYPIFVLSIVVTGFYLILMSGSPAGRTRAKSIFWKLIIGMILISISVDLFKLMVEIAYGMSLKILATIQMPPFPLDISNVIFFVISIFLAIFVMPLILISIGLRLLLVLIMAALFPLTLFLCLFDIPIIGLISREIGNKLFRYTLAVIFAQPVQAIMLAITVIAVKNVGLASGFSGSIASICMAIAGMIAIAIAPLMVMGALKWIGGAFMVLGMIAALKGNIAAGYVATAIGGMMMGMGPSSLLAAGGAASFGVAKRYGEHATHHTHH